MRSKKAAINVVSSIILQIVTIIYGFIIPKLIITHFGSSINGLVASITQFLAYITLLEAGFGPVVKSVLYKPIANKDKTQIEQILKTSEKFFRTIAFIFIAYIVVLCAVLPNILSNEFDKMFTLSLIIIISISTFAEYYLGITNRLYLQAEQKTYITSFIDIGTIILNTIMVVILIYINCNIQIIKVVSTAIFVMRPIIQNIYVKKKYGIKIKSAEPSYLIKQKWDGFAQHIAYVIHKNTDIVLLTIFSSLQNVSVYSVYYMIINGIEALIKPFSFGISSTFGDMIAKEEYNNLQKKFEMYETCYYFICAVVYSCTLLLIIPFVKVYTKNITDANYINKTFGYLIVIGSLLFSIRTLYNDLANTAGCFKEMRKGAIIEAICNIIISIILIREYGIVGVAIGTVAAMAVRTIDLIRIINRKILKRNMIRNIKKLLVLFITIIFIFLICNCIQYDAKINLLNWIIKSLIYLLISTFISSLSAIVFYKRDLKEIISILNKLLHNNKRKEKQNEF